MKVFLGWSGNTSHKVALAFHNWLPRVIQTIVPWVSSEDIAKGARWNPDIAKQLEASRYGIICVTRDNVNSPWINFEAGALSKEINQSYVSPFVFNLKPSEINGPLSQFQYTVNEKADLKKLLFTINDKKEHVLQKDALEDAFEMWWPQLENKLAQIEKEGSSTPAPERREPQAMLEELLETTRELQRGASKWYQAEKIAEMIKESNAANETMLRDLLAMIGTLARNSERQLAQDAYLRVTNPVRGNLITGSPLSGIATPGIPNPDISNMKITGFPPPPKSEPDK
jgi:hypothetical protein